MANTTLKLLFILSVGSISQKANAQKPCQVNLNDLSTTYFVPVKVPPIEDKHIPKEQLLSTLGLLVECEYYIDDSTKGRLKVSHYTFEIIRDGFPFFQKQFDGPFFVKEIMDQIEATHTNDIVKFKDIKVNLLDHPRMDVFKLPANNPLVNVKTNDIEFQIDKTDELVNFTKEEQAAIDEILNSPEMKYVKELFSTKRDPDRSNYFRKPYNGDSGSTIIIELWLNMQQPYVKEEIHIAYQKFIFVYNRSTKNTTVRDEFRNKQYSLKEWKQIAKKIE